MIATHIGELLRRLRSGIFEAADAEMLEKSRAADFRADLIASYRWVFQEHRLKNKWEFGTARSVGFEMVPCRMPGIVPSFHVYPVLRQCVFCSGDGDSISGISVISKLVLRPQRDP